MREPAPVISLSAVSKRFGPVLALDAVTLALREGEFFALLGPSGCGKTTLLRIIAGFEQPDSGTVGLDGADITGLRANRRPVNLMFQSYALFPHMSVRANISYGLEMERLARAEVARRTDEALEMVALGDVAGRRPDQLSGGQRQRVALARALVKRPRVLLLDEPLAALDKMLRGQMQIELKRLQHEVGITFIVVTHDQDEALVMADRVALMQDGRIAQLGTPRQLYERPESRFVAGFIGVSNFFDGIAEPGGVRAGRLGLLAGTSVSAPAAAAPRGTAASLALRPERIALSADRPAAADSAVPGTVAEVAYHGQDVTVHVAVQGLGTPLLVRIPAVSANPDDWRIGQPVWCGWRRQDARILMN